MRTLGFILSVFFLWPAPAQSQGDLYFEYLTEDQGLPINDTWSLAQDHQGYIWMSLGIVALYRYDGYNFKQYVFDPDNPQSLSNTCPTDFLEDSRQNLWIGTWNGLNLYNRNQDNFRHFLAQAYNEDGFSVNPIYDLYEDHRGRVWLSQQELKVLVQLESGFQITSYSHSADTASIDFLPISLMSFVPP